MEMNYLSKKASQERVLIKMCHVCGQVIESASEVQRCPKCNKSFLPLNYFAKVHDIKTSDDFKHLFEDCNALNEDDLIKGIHVLW